MLENTTKRRLTDEFKRKVVALWKMSGASAAQPRVSPMALPGDQALEIARLRRELDRTRMERGTQKIPRHLYGDAAVKFAFIEQHASTWPVTSCAAVAASSG